MEAADPLEYELQKEISDIVIQNYVCGLHREFEMKLWEHQNCISTLNRSRKEKVSEIAVLQDELHCILNVVVSSESGIHSHQSHSSLEDQTIVRMKDDNKEPPVTEKATDKSEVMLEIPDFSLLKHMQSEEIMNFLKTEWLKLRRQHESELHQKTEELFRVKREYARAKASLPLKKERELEFIKSKLHQTISKLGEIASRKQNSCFDCNENEEMCRLKDRIGMLLHENNRLRGLLADKREENKHLSSQVSDAKSKIAQHSLSEAKLLNKFEKIRAELEDVKIERHLNNLVDLSVFGEVFDDYENQIYDMNQEGSFLKELLDEKEDQLTIMYEDRQKLKYENNQLVSIAGSIMQHHDQVNLVNDELLMFKEKVCEQELLILESKGEYSSMKRCLYEAMQQIQVCKQEILELTENLTSMSVALVEAKEQNASLDATIREMKKTPAKSIGSHWEQAGESDIATMEKLSKAYSDFETRLAEAMKRNETRLTSIICQFNPLVQQVAVLRKKEFWYKQILEIKCSNLRKAEAEVDILGDEVDTLLSVMGKIYIALDHYSPVLKHYPGPVRFFVLPRRSKCQFVTTFSQLRRVRLQHNSRHRPHVSLPTRPSPPPLLDRNRTRPADASPLDCLAKDAEIHDPSTFWKLLEKNQIGLAKVDSWSNRAGFKGSTTAPRIGSRTTLRRGGQCAERFPKFLLASPSFHGGRGALPSAGGHPSDLTYLAGGGASEA